MERASPPQVASYPKSKEVICVYIFDPRHYGETEWGSPKTGAFRAKFLIEAVESLRANLQALGSDLLVGIGRPEELLPLVTNRDTKLLWQEQVTQQELIVDEMVRAALPSTTSVEMVWSGTLYERSNLPYRVDLADMPDLFKPFRATMERRGGWREQAHMMLPTPEGGSLPLPEAGGFDPPANTPLGFDVLPKLQGEAEAALDSARFIYKGGETAALQRLRYFLWESNCLAEAPTTTKGIHPSEWVHAEDENAPATFAPWLAHFPGLRSTKLSPWLSSGSLSPRMVASELKQYELSRPGVIANKYSLIFELLVRDFYRFNAVKHNPQMFSEEGPVGREHVFYNMFLESPDAKSLEWSGPKPSEDELMEAWKAGKTGVPIIDANMRELAATGYISHRGRQVVASFLVFDLGVHWRRGADFFESLLIDYDVASNWGNWAMAAGLTGGRVIRHEPVALSKEFDLQGSYLRYWLPELARIPATWVHEPWLLSPEQQQEYHAVIGQNYPQPIKEMPGYHIGNPPKQGGPYGRGRRNLATATLQADTLQDTLQAEVPSFATEEETCSLQASQLVEALGDGWFDEWQRRLQGWWVATPLKSGIQACTGALGLHIAQRLELFIRMWQSKRLGGGGLGDKTTAHQPTTSADCNALFEAGGAKLGLPAFPNLPDQFEAFDEFSIPAVPPIPRLTPEWTLLQSQLEEPQRAAQLDRVSAQAPAISSPNDGSGANSVRPMAAIGEGALGGFAGVAAAVLVLALWRTKERRTRRALVRHAHSMSR